MTKTNKILLGLVVTITLLFTIVMSKQGNTAGDYLDQQLRIEQQIQKLTQEKFDLQKKRDKLVADARGQTGLQKESVTPTTAEQLIDGTQTE